MKYNIFFNREDQENLKITNEEQAEFKILFTKEKKAFTLLKKMVTHKVIHWTEEFVKSGNIEDNYKNKAWREVYELIFKDL